MDYLFFSVMRHSGMPGLKVSYDIACQWSKHVWECMTRLPHNLQLHINKKQITFLVPEFHLPAHIEACQTMFLFNFTPGIERTDGEAPERGWANINPAASSTKEIGPDAKRDILNDHFGHSN